VCFSDALESAKSAAGKAHGMRSMCGTRRQCSRCLTWFRRERHSRLVKGGYVTVVHDSKQCYCLIGKTRRSAHACLGRPSCVATPLR
jgi:hypothetical protein